MFFECLLSVFLVFLSVCDCPFVCITKSVAVVRKLESEQAAATAPDTALLHQLRNHSHRSSIQSQRNRDTESWSAQVGYQQQQ